jgi:hypothetical protein
VSGETTAESSAAARRKAIDVGARRARWTTWVLGVVALRSLFEGWVYPGLWLRGPWHLWPFPSAANVLPVVVFLLWLHRAMENAKLLGSPSSWSSGKALVAFLVPVVNLVLPYWPMMALFRASDPDRLPDAPVYRDRDQADYRGGLREAVAPPRWRYPSSVLAWALLFGARPVPGFVGSFLEIAEAVNPSGLGRTMVNAAVVARLVEVAAAVACILLVRSIDARQREQCRRLDAMQPAP